MSKTNSLSAELRKRTGSGVLKQMRREGFIPSVIYGGGSENQNVKVPTKAFTDLIAHSASSNIIVNLDVEGKKQLAFIQDLQSDPLTGKIIHADFRAVDESTEITAHLPVVFHGEPKGVKQGGLLEQLVHTLEINCLPKDLPETIGVDVEHLGVGDSVHVSEIVFSEGVTTTVSGEVLVGTVAKTRAAQSEGTSGEDAPAAEENSEGESSGDE